MVGRGTTWVRLGSGDPPAAWWLGAVVLLGCALLVGVRRAGRADALTITQLPGVPAWLFLVVLLALGPIAARSGRAHGAVAAAVPLGLAGVHVVVWWSGPALLQFAVSMVVAVALAMYTVHALRTVGGDALTVARLGAVLASVLLTATFVLEAVDAFAEASSSIPAAVVDAWGPSLAAVAVLVGMSTLERALPGAERLVVDDVGGTVQILLFAAGWLALVAGAAVDSLSLGVSAVGLHVLAVAVFVVRAAARIEPRDALSPASRWSAAAVVAAAAYLGVLVHVVVGLVDQRYVDSSAIPAWLEITVDLTAFGGLAGNAVIGLTLRAGELPGDDRVAGAIFGLYNAGLIGAAVGATRALDAVAVGGWSAMVVAVSAVAVRALKVDAGPFAPGQQHTGGLPSETQTS